MARLNQFARLLADSEARIRANPLQSILDAAANSRSIMAYGERRTTRSWRRPSR